MILVNIARGIAGLTVAGFLNFLVVIAFMLAVFGRLDLGYLALIGINGGVGTLALVAAFLTRPPSILAGLIMILCGLVTGATGFFLINVSFYAGGAVVVAGVLYMLGVKFQKPARVFYYR